jgi:hypothetical protein
MKEHFFLQLITRITFLVFLAGIMQPQALYSQEIITLWTFDDTTEPASGEGVASMVGGVTQHSATLANGWRVTTFPDQFEATGTAGVEFMVSTLGYENIVLGFLHQSSATMSRWAEIQYTLDEGSNWFVLMNNEGGLAPGGINLPFSFDFTGITEANDNPMFGVRILSVFSPVPFNPNVPNVDYSADTAYHRARETGGNPYAGTGNWRFLNVTFSGDVILGDVPVKLVITEVNGGEMPYVNTPFEVVVQAYDNNNLPSNVTTDTQVALTKETGSGILGGTLTGIIPTGSNTVVFDNVLYDTPETGVSIKASATGGMSLAPAISEPFEVHDLNPQITVISPNGGEQWDQGSVQQILWESQDFTGNVKILIIRGLASPLVTDIPNNGSWEWNIPPDQPVANNYKIRVEGMNPGDPKDDSDDFFSIIEEIIPKDIITQWTFDGTTEPALGFGVASLIGDVTQHSATISSGWRITDFPDQYEASGTAGAQFMVSTVGFEEITLDFGHRSSGTMSRWAEIQYTLDGGNSWLIFTNNGGNLTPHDEVYPFSFDFSPIEEINNNPLFGVRIVSIFSPVAFNPEVPDSTIGANTAYHRARTPGTGGNPYAGSGNWRLLELTFSGYPLVTNDPVQLAVIAINDGSPPTENQPFNVKIQTLDEDDLPSPVTQDTEVMLSLVNGVGSLGGSLSGLMPEGTHTFEFENLTYDTADQGVVLEVSATSGLTLAPGLSAPFDVLPEMPFPMVIINEIMYNPPESDNDTLEYLELYNKGNFDVNLKDWYFSEGIEFVFPDVILGAGEYLVIAKDAAVVFNAFGVEALQWTSGSLSNSGEELEIRTAGGEVVDYVDYNDAAPWPKAPDGFGPSLALIDPDLNNTMPESWAPETTFTFVNDDGIPVYGTPGAPNFLTSGQGILIPEGWSGLSSFIIPQNALLDELLEYIVDDITLMQNFYQIFLPEYNVNTIGNWNTQVGYQIKMDQRRYLVIIGNPIENKTVNLANGWNIMPVLSSCDVDADELFGSSPEIIFVFEMGSANVYWPEGGIFTLEQLNPGNAYYIKAGNETPVTFPECDE